MAEVTQTVAHTEVSSTPEQEPTALGFGPAAWVAIAMLMVFALAIWKKVPGAIGKALDAKIAAEERSAIAEVRATTARAATTAAATLIAERHDAGSDKVLVDQAIAGLGSR